MFVPTAEDFADDTDFIAENVACAVDCRLRDSILFQICVHKTFTLPFTDKYFVRLRRLLDAAAKHFCNIFDDFFKKSLSSTLNLCKSKNFALSNFF